MDFNPIALTAQPSLLLLRCFFWKTLPGFLHRPMQERKLYVARYPVLSWQFTGQWGSKKEWNIGNFAYTTVIRTGETGSFSTDSFSFNISTACSTPSSGAYCFRCLLITISLMWILPDKRNTNSHFQRAPITSQGASKSIVSKTQMLHNSVGLHWFSSIISDAN